MVPMMLPSKMRMKDGVLNTIHTPSMMITSRPHMRHKTALVEISCSSPGSLLSATWQQHSCVWTTGMMV